MAILQIAKSWNSGCKCRSNLCRNVRDTNVCGLSRLDCMCASGVRTQRLYRSCWTKSWALRCCCCCRMCSCAMATQELLYCRTAVSLAFLCTQRECAFIFLCMHIEKPDCVHLHLRFGTATRWTDWRERWLIGLCIKGAAAVLQLVC